MTSEASGHATAETIEFNSTLLVHDNGNRPEIVFYLPHDDIAETVINTARSAGNPEHAGKGLDGLRPDRGARLLSGQARKT
ncbi:hypothetical protein J2Y41_003920 [Arthrobacter sp. 1088]|uniref:hypothetical protein n=1 Tax=Arthrobacter sp. 1088 TaxID=2817768 RepID=UPI00285A0856|nr:hypothetical protein [Arthrobacter sp. 1088]MDR6688334.1 hypothetical protein [Arthrobacter sp. 1088]